MITGSLVRCDLLRKLYLCGVNYNNIQRFIKMKLVVICLKSCIFVVSITTRMMIIALRLCCDLLKKLYLCGVNYNLSLILYTWSIVVICLKSCIFVVSITTRMMIIALRLCCDLLKKLYLCGVNYNLIFKLETQISSCDLLKKLYLCGVNYNTI